MPVKSSARYSPPLTWGLIFLFGSLLLLQACGPNPTEAPTATPRAADSAGKIDSLLLDIYLRYTTAQGSEADKQKAAIDYAREQGLINKKDEVTFELELEDPARLDPVNEKIKSMGGRTIDSANIEGLVKMRVAVPVNTFISYANSATKDNFLRDLAAFQGVKSIQVIIGRDTQELRGMPETREALWSLFQTSQNEGVKVMGADKWQAAGFKGKGVKIGVVDQGFKYYEDFVGKTLPPNLNFRDQDKETGGDGVTDVTVHGTAVLEILYSLAPEADFYAVAVDRSDNELVAGIDYLASQGVNIISMSLGGHSTAGDGTDPLNVKIDNLRQSKSILFFISAGNEGDAHYVGQFDPDEQGFHQFLPGVTRMAIGNPSTVPFRSAITLNWEQWQERGKATDLDLFVEDKDGNPITSKSNDQRYLPPVEYLPISTKPRDLFYVRVRLKPTAAKPTKPFRLHIFTHDLPVQFYTPTLAVASPADSKRAFAVGAVDWDKDMIAYYSSQGPLPNGAFKPEISAPTGVTSQAYAEEGDPNFDGTSAACPEAAGLAAVIKSANPRASLDDLTQLILQSVKDLGAPGPDTAYGYGRSSLSEAAPGQLQLKPNFTTPTPNPNPPLNLKTSRLFPAPKGVPVTPRPGTPTSAATATVPPTNTAAPATTAPVISAVTFQDDFRSANSGLPNAVPTTYENGAYRIKANANQLVWSVYPNTVQVEDFTAEVKVQGINDRNGVYGLVFWLQSSANYYLLSVSGGGQAQVSQFSNGQWREVLPWNALSGWKAGSANTLRLVAGMGQVSVAVNGKASSRSAQAKGSGSLGFAVGGYAQPANATFSDFRLSAR